MKKESNEAYEWCESIVFALGVAMIVLVFFFKTSRISGPSMFDTLSDGDQVIVRSVFYTPQRGDVVITDAWIDYDKPLSKRVIALAGDTVNITEDGTVSVNNQVLDEPYILGVTQPRNVAFPLVVPQGKVFVMGDNREHSSDSRDVSIGFVGEADILGKVIFRISPLSNMGAIA